MSIHRWKRLGAFVPLVAMLAAILPFSPAVTQATPSSARIATTQSTPNFSALNAAEDAALVRESLRHPIQEDVFYFVLPDRFNNGDQANDQGGISGDKFAHGFDPADKGFFHGGDIKGLQAKLDYLQDMGVTAIWMTPIFKNKPVQGSGADISAGYHGYWITDFTQIDPHLGTNADLTALVDDAHSRGMKVFFDIITNHTADVIQYEGDSANYISKTEEPYKNASGEPFDDKEFAGTETFPPLDPDVSFPYVPTVDPAEADVKVPAWLNDVTNYHNRGNSTFSGESSEYGDFFGLDDLFTEQPDVVDGMADIYKTWITEFGIDGYRIDTVKHVNIEFWQKFGPEIEAYAKANGKPDFFMYGEVFDGNPAFVSQYTTTGKLPAALDFPFQGTATGFASGSSPTNNLRTLFANDDFYTDADSNAYRLPTFLGNHDMGRFGNFLRGGNAGASNAELLSRDTLAHALMFTARGMPVVYYGDEQGFVGDGGDKDARQDMMPSLVASYNDDDLIGTDATTAQANFDQSHPLYTAISDLAALRAEHPALQYGAQIHRYSTDQAGIYAFSRIDRDEKIEYIVALNNAETEKSTTFATYNAGMTFTALTSGASSLTSDASGNVSVTLPPLSYAVYRANSALPAVTTAPAIEITTPAADGAVRGRVEVGAELDADVFAEVTFAVKQGDGAYEVIGTDDNAPYRVFYDVSGLDESTQLTFKAIVNNVTDDSGDSHGALNSATVATTVSGAPADGPSTVTIAGSLQSELGCAEDWQPACANTRLTYDADDDVWQGTFMVPAGTWEYKAALNGAWDESYGGPGGSNLTLELTEATAVKFYYDHKTNWITSNQNAIIATVPGNFQSEIGCPGDWQPDCLRSWLQDPDGDGIYTFTTTAIPAGSYEAKVAINESWDENYGVDGALNGANIPFTVDADGTEVLFSFDSESKVLTISANACSPDYRYAVVHYSREDGNYEDWGLHLWGDAIDPSEVTEWTAPKQPNGEDDYGVFWLIKLQDASQPVNFIVHKPGGDEVPTTREPGGDRSFVPAESPQIWLQSGDETVYTSQAEAQGFVTLHYSRVNGDYDDWGLHLWGDAIADGVATEWSAPRQPDGEDDYGVYFNIPIKDASQPVNFIVHTPSGDEVPTTREPGGDRSFVPLETADVWLQQGDEAIYTSRADATNTAIIHYQRPDGDYGDYTSNDFANFWGLHVWTGAANPNPSWQQPLKPAGQDAFGVYFEVPLTEGATTLNYILHRGDTKDQDQDQALDVATWGREVWIVAGEPGYALPIINECGPSTPRSEADLTKARAHWISRDTIAWDVEADDSVSYKLHYDPNGTIELVDGQLVGGMSIDLTIDPAGVDPGLIDDKFEQLAGYTALKISADDLAKVPDILKGQIVVSATAADGFLLDATNLQIPGVLDDLYSYDGSLGVEFNGDVPTLRLWAPTARSVSLKVFPDPNYPDVSDDYAMTFNPNTGVWSVTGNSSWNGAYYLYEVEVYVPSTGQVETNLVTDPYSVSLSMNSTRSQIIDLSSDAYKPESWESLSKPALAAPEDIVLYELHVRDFSIYDETVPEAYRGTYKAFTQNDSNGMQHLSALADAGLTHIHLLPVFDIATINENKAERQEPDQAVLEAGGPAGTAQREEIARVRDEDGFNWGYDPFHYTTPEGSYSTDPNGPTRILEFREMVKGLADNDLRVVMDVVYNHTNSSGQDEKSVLDRVVPGYYHRLNADGNVETSTCCQNTATEHDMMEKLMIDSVLTWATQYKVDAFRFDLMGHHSKDNMLKLRAELDKLTLAEHGVDGKSIYLYGEGWNFGEVANNARFEQATQLNMAGTGIGTFNDRLRDGVRGGGPFDGGQALVANQGFINGLFYDPNAANDGSADEKDRLLLATDWIRIGNAGNMRDYTFENRNGEVVKGSEIDYNGSPAGYTADPQETITYVEAHDNQTLWDNNAYKLPLDTSMEDRVRAQNLGNAIVMLGQGVPFFHAGQDMLRSKSLDRNSYNSGDWFNRLDFSYETNNWGVGLPPAENPDDEPIQRALLENLDLKPGKDDILQAVNYFHDLLEIRKSSPLFRLRTGADVQSRVVMHNTGPDQLPALHVMSIDDTVGANLDETHARIVVLVNANDVAQTFTEASLQGVEMSLHPVQQNGSDQVVKSATYNAAAGSFTIPARTTAVFVAYDDEGTDPEPEPTSTTIWMPMIMQDRRQ